MNSPSNDDVAAGPFAERLVGPRLTLRAWTGHDADSYRQLVAASLDHLQPWMTWASDTPKSDEEIAVFVEETQANLAAGSDAVYAVERSDTGEIVGGCGLHPRGPANTLDIGYWIGAPFIRRGYAREIVEVLTAAALDRPGVDTVRISHDATNVASGRVAASAGFGFARQLIENDQRVWMWRFMNLPGISFRLEQPSDHVAIRQVVAAAFGSEAEAGLVEAIRASEHYRPELALVAELEGDIIGHIMISGCTIAAEQGRRPIVMLSPLAVAPEYQGKGVGGSLVRCALDRAEAGGEPLVILEGAPRYYGRFGFEAASEHGLTVHVPDWAPPEAGQVVLLSGYHQLDDSQKGELRGDVVYPEAFDDLD